MPDEGIFNFSIFTNADLTNAPEFVTGRKDVNSLPLRIQAQLKTPILRRD